MTTPDAAPALEVPDAWRAVAARVIDRGGVAMALGAGDAGKSTFLAWLAREALAAGRAAWLVDADVGQSDLGPPTTVAAAPVGAASAPALYFTGSDSPRGHLLPSVVGTGRMVAHARAHGADLVLVNTTGWVADGAAVALKVAKVDLARPDHVLAFQRGDELAGVLRALRGLAHPAVVPCAVAAAARARNPNERRDRRVACWARYLAGAPVVALPLDAVGVSGDAPESLARRDPRGRPVGLYDARNECVAVGPVVGYEGGVLRVLAPVPCGAVVARVHLGSGHVAGHEPPAPPPEPTPAAGQASDRGRASSPTPT